MTTIDGRKPGATPDCSQVGNKAIPDCSQVGNKAIPDCLQVGNKAIALKPPVRASRSARIIVRESKRLSREAEELIFETAQLISEGNILRSAERTSYFGSSMFAIPISALAAKWRGDLDSVACRELVALVGQSVRVRLRAVRLARAEAARKVSGHALGTAVSETRVRLHEQHLLIDVDIEVPLRGHVSIAAS